MCSSYTHTCAPCVFWSTPCKATSQLCEPSTVWRQLAATSYSLLEIQDGCVLLPMRKPHPTPARCTSFSLPTRSLIPSHLSLSQLDFQPPQVSRNTVFNLLCIDLSILLLHRPHDIAHLIRLFSTRSSEAWFVCCYTSKLKYLSRVALHSRCVDTLG